MDEPEVTVVEYDPAWPELYERESERVRELLGDRVVLTEHFGSTAVPSLAAKPIIDVIVLLEDRELAPDAVDELEGAGYRIHRDWETRTVLRRSSDERHGFNLHCCWSETIPEVEGNLAFRDYLRDNPKMRDRYGKLKQEAAAEFPDDIERYYEAKNTLVTEIVERADEEGYEEQIDLSIDR